MKKICIICPSLYPHLANKQYATDGGAETQLKTLGMALSKRGFDVHFFVGDYGQPDKEIFNKITVHKIPFRYRGGSNFYLLETWLRLWEVLLNLQPDFHLIKFPRDLLFPLGIFCKIMRKKTVFIGQIDNDASPEYIKKNENVFSYYLFRIGLKLTNVVVAQNNNQKVGFLKFYQKESEIIPNILTMPISKQKIKKDYILWVGNTLPKKRPHLFLELAQKLKNYRFKMIMAPTSSRPDDSFIRVRAERINNLDYIGYVPFSEISNYFQGACILVSTSEKEGFPNTFLQAWQHRTPVVSLKANPDGIIDRHNLGFHSKTIEMLVQNVEKIMEDKQLRLELGKNGKEYVDNFHSENAILTKYLDIIES